MSEFHVEIVKIGKIGKHPNADTLSITNIHGGYPVIFRTDQFKEGDLAVYIPVDAMVPLKRPEFQFLQRPNNTKEWERIKAKKLRGIFSMGLLIPCPQDLVSGTNVQLAYGIEKWEPIIETSTSGDQEKDPGFIPIYTDIEGLRKYKHLLEEGEYVVLTEKIHGANARFLWKDDRLWVGSHRQIKADSPKSMWWRAARENNLAEKLAKFPDHVFYGEVYGQVQDLLYGAKPGQLFLRFFDIYSIKKGKYLDWDDFLLALADTDLEPAPTLYYGPWKEELCKEAEGESTLATNVREGFVVKPVRERWDQKVGRVIFKYIGEGFHLR